MIDELKLIEFIEELSFKLIFETSEDIYKEDLNKAYIAGATKSLDILRTLILSGNFDKKIKRGK